MKQFKRNRLLEMAGVVHRSDILKEGDDLFDDEGGDEEEAGGDEGGGDDLFGDEGGGDEETGGDAEEGEEDAEEPAEEEEEGVETLSNDELAEFGPGEIDQKIDSVMQQIFTDSLESGKVKAISSVGYPGQKTDEDIVEESINRFSMKFLLEGEEAEEKVIPEEQHAENFDLDFYTEEVARYIKNYQTILDVEGMIFNKAKQFLLNQFDAATSEDFEEKLALIYKLDFSGDYEEEIMPPDAAGATTAGGGGA